MADFSNHNPYGIPAQPVNLYTPDGDGGLVDEDAFLAAMTGTQFAGTGVPDIFGPISNPIPPPPPPPPPQRIAGNSPGLPMQFPEEAPGPSDDGLPSIEDVGRGLGVDLIDPYASEHATGFPDALYADADAGSSTEAPPFAAAPALPEAEESTFDSVGGALGNLWGKLTGEQSAPTNAEPIDPYSQETLDADTSRLADLDPEAFQVIKGKQQLARDNYLATERLRVAEADRRQAEDDTRAHRAAMASAEQAARKLEADTTALANEKIDPERWWSSRSTGQKIAGYLSAILGGWLSADRGGRNSGLDMIMSAIDQDIDAQKANLAHRTQVLGARRGMVADMYARAGDAQEAATKVRIASLKALDNEIESRAAMLDPEGAARLHLAQIKRGVRAEIAAAQQAAADANYERVFQHEKEIVIPRERMAQDERQNRRSVGLGYANLNQERDEFKYQKEKDVADREVEREKIGAERTAKGDAFTIYDANGEPMLQPNKTPFRARDAEEAKKLSARLAATQSLAEVVDEIERIRGTGVDVSSAIGLSKFTNTDDAQKLGSLINHAIVTYGKANGLGALDAGTIAIGKEIFGDPMALLSNKAALESARTSLVSGARSELRRAGYRGEYGVTDTTEDQNAAPTPSSDAVKRIRAGRTPEQLKDDDQPGPATVVGARVFSPFWKTPREERPDRIREASASLTNPNVTTEQAKDLDYLARRSAAGNAEDRKRIVQMAKESGRPDLARGAMTALAEAGDMDALVEIGQGLDPESDLGKHAATAWEGALSVQIGDLGTKARSADPSVRDAAQRELLNLASNTSGDIRQQAVDALTGAKARASSPAKGAR